jgi:hypothetical protein
MEYFILNDHSLPFDKEEDIDAALRLFFDIYRASSSVNFKTIRISNRLDSGWFSIPILDGYYIRNWIDQQDIDDDYRKRIKSLITSTQSPIFSVEEIEAERAKLSEFVYKEEEVPSLGACYLLNQLALSFNSNIKWNANSFEIEHQELKDESCEIERSLVSVNNVTTLTHWEEHYSIIQQQKIQNLQQSESFLSDFKNLFEHIKLLPNVKRSLERGEFPPVFHQRIWEAITSLNSYVQDCLGKKKSPNYTDLIPFTQLKISDESDSVKNNNKFNRHRYFRYNETQYFFGYHIKNFPSSQRMHFLILGNEIIIGYIGKHLPLPIKK